MYEPLRKYYGRKNINIILVPSFSEKIKVMNPFSSLKNRFNNGDTFVSLSKEECARCEETVGKNDMCRQTLEELGIAFVTGAAISTATGILAVLQGVDPRVSLMWGGAAMLLRTLVGIPMAAHNTKQYEKGFAFMQQNGRPFAEVPGFLEPVPTCERPDRLAQTYKAQDLKS